MKKIFTLMAVAALAVSANAQEEVLLFENGATVTSGQTFTTENTTLVLGNDLKKAAGWDVKANSYKGDYLVPFSQKVMVEEEEKDRFISVCGGDNPKDDVAAKGGGFNGSGEVGKLPQSGTYYVITPKKSGTILAGIILNSDKELYIVDGTDKVETEVLDADFVPTGAYTQNVINADAMFTGEQMTLYDSDGNEAEWTYGGKNGIVVADKLTGTVEFKVKANREYYVFCTGSKLSFFGYIFTPGEDDDTDAINEVSTKTVANGVSYNLAGQQVSKSFKGIVIRDGKKFIQK